MIGNPSSCGIFAPCLTYDNDTFYLIYTDVKNIQGPFWDSNNYLVTSDRIDGEWSEPVYLNSSGFDPSLFHDDDGRKWLVNLLLDHRGGDRPKFPNWNGIVLQEYSEKQKKLVGEPVKIFSGSEIGTTEGAPLYKREGRYYLLTAEGGTFEGHAVTMARSESIAGPYEIDPKNPILTSRYDANLKLQRSGHADIVQTQNGQWYMVHLCGRPIGEHGRCVLGRETAIQKVYWTEDGWLRLEGGKNTPEVYVEAPDLAEHKWEKIPERDDFDGDGLDINFQTLRKPLGQESLTISERPGYLRLYGAESLSSKHNQTLVARRQQSICFEAATCLEFEPESYQQMAGLIYFYDTINFCYLHVSYTEEFGKCLNVLICDLNEFSYPIGNRGLSIEGWERCYLKLQVYTDKGRFYCSPDGAQWQSVGSEIDASKLSDEYFKENSIERFTGAFVGLCCQDFTGKKINADFDYFEYKEMD
jgi:xylan 1,4-beta-xylosidase